ncbi:hypothetical protein A4A49_26932 [Nicotiana attenuata]|uniref:Uncharacterized protein n=1 Tax=Nicotiana attenuata TaxID=49451 RepID=A0A1J6KAI7_NICAT|nr:hypothetical protein A4A49_26932 [Nicotiana attenuata]
MHTTRRGIDLTITKEDHNASNKQRKSRQNRKCVTGGVKSELPNSTRNSQIQHESTRMKPKLSKFNSTSNLT